MFTNSTKMALGSEAEVSGAEGDLAAMRFHIGRLAPGYVRNKLEESMRMIEVEVCAARRARSASNEFVVVERMDEEQELSTGDEQEVCASEVAADARTKLEKALRVGEAARPRSSHEAAAACMHALLVSKAAGFPGLRCIGVPTKGASASNVTGFAAPVRDLDPWKLLPPGWNEKPGRPAFKYRRDGAFQPVSTAEVFELRCHIADRADGSQRLVGLSLSSASRGELHRDEIAVDFEGTAVPGRRFDELADYVRDVVAPRLAPTKPPPEPQFVSKPQVGMTKPPDGVFDTPASRQPRHLPAFDCPDDMLVGPTHPIFGGAPASVAAPRFDPIVPGDLPPGPTFPGLPARPEPKRLPGEPDFDHLKPPGDRDDSMYL